jgi:hypothetical protein
LNVGGKKEENFAVRRFAFLEIRQIIGQFVRQEDPQKIAKE